MEAGAGMEAGVVYAVIAPGPRRFRDRVELFGWSCRSSFQVPQIIHAPRLSVLVDGKILQWEPFGAGTTDVLVRDVASGKLSWYASHGLTPIDGQGPLPSRTEVRKLRETEMAASLGKIAERWAKEPPRPRIRR